MGAGMVTDLYELTMFESYLARGMTEPATFSLFARDLPDDRGFLVACGLDGCLDLLENFAFDADDLGWLGEQGFRDRTLDALDSLRFDGEVWAIPEGRIVLPEEPLLEVTASLPVAQLVETLVVNQLTYQTALASKAVRCRLAAGGRAALVDFGLRRTHGIEAGMAAARATAIAGFAGTSNVEAARRYGLTAVGTMAHSYIQSFVDQRDAFLAYGRDFPERSTFLVDTYDTLAGVDTAIEVADELGLRDHVGVRLDSGDLLGLSIETRRRLDAAGRPEVAIVASGGLDEHDVQRLLDQGAPIDVFGVGTRVGVSADAPTLDTAYKLVEYAGRPVMKLSTGKASRPGPKQVFRGEFGTRADVLACREETPLPGAEAVLVPVMREGRRVAPPEPIEAAAARLDADLASLPDTAHRLVEPTPPEVRVSERLTTLGDEVRSSLRDAAGLPPGD